MSAGLMHADARSVWGASLAPYARTPVLEAGQLAWREPPALSLDESVLRGVADPFCSDGGLRRLSGNLGQAMVKVSAVRPEHWTIEAPARVFDDQAKLESAFKAGSLDADFVAVVRFHGPRANGMPELHKLTPLLASLQDRGRRVALVTDGRMSGASGKVLAAIHVTPEALDGGPLARIADGDLIKVDARTGRLEARVPHDTMMRRDAAARPAGADQGTGRELFSLMRSTVGAADRGASFLFGD